MWFSSNLGFPCSCSKEVSAAILFELSENEQRCDEPIQPQELYRAASISDKSTIKVRKLQKLLWSRDNQQLSTPFAQALLCGLIFIILNKTYYRTPVFIYIYQNKYEQVYNVSVCRGTTYSIFLFWMYTIKIHFPCLTICMLSYESQRRGLYLLFTIRWQHSRQNVVRIENGGKMGLNPRAYPSRVQTQICTQKNLPQPLSIQIMKRKKKKRGKGLDGHSSNGSTVAFFGGRFPSWLIFAFLV